MFHFGFSYIGLVFLLMLFIPNIIWAKHQPAGYEDVAKNENRVLLTFERIGEVLVSCLVLIFSDFNIRKTWWTGWLIAAFIAMLLYELFWVRYFRSEKTLADFYASLLGIPVAGATLPVIAVFLLGIYGSNGFLMLANVFLGIGHIGIHLGHRKEAVGPGRKRKLWVRAMLMILALAGALLVGHIIFICGSRNFNYIEHYRLIGSGVDEGIYVGLGGEEQYVLVRGRDPGNPVIIYLHGGPSSPDSYVTYAFSNYLTEDYTVIAWDQRGCGRTYVRNEAADPENKTADFDRALADLDELVEYAKDRFGQEKVIILGHSYGTILGSIYAKEHPEKVSAYIGAAQVTSLREANEVNYEDALQKVREAGDDPYWLTAAYEAFLEDSSLTNLMVLRNLASAYHKVPVSDKSTWLAVMSPYFGVDDLRWFLKQLGNMGEYWELNRQLFEYTFAFDVYSEGMSYEMPAYFISGSEDWICPVDSVSRYAEAVSAPDVDVKLLPGCGHNLQYSQPKKFAEAVKECLGGGS